MYHKPRSKKLQISSLTNAPTSLNLKPMTPSVSMSNETAGDLTPLAPPYIASTVPSPPAHPTLNLHCMTQTSKPMEHGQLLFVKLA
ncbi:hypothetical protein PAXRUDRAFT_16688 [Paxillus rubicundulus Ve08.2h10]|uniref:Uncharacterized protein n=1 Tax=Paxillus rubicundulus Ve08.2h10 TaxID=930991 RepID=A0A0D0C6R6_9AGAM|nr:hypothetical protein PAXRUDRAFT_16688 [Paxillus rubicundulus Ve08.2h10]